MSPIQLLPNESSIPTEAAFEGPEKTIEIWFTPNMQTPYPALRTIPMETWAQMLEIVQAKILSSITNQFVDAYLLSESSMFVYPYRITLKTCGTTTLLNAVPKILEIATSIGLSRVDSIFYSRKAFLFPEKQVYPHGRWDNEVSFLDHLFPETQFDTSGYVVGKVNRDHWCLYLATPISGTDDDGKDDQEDLTLEVMMTGLSKRKTKLFWGKSYTGEPDILNKSKISNIYPDSLIDDHTFDPCGYSLNGLLGQNYYTIHVTPEDHCSYASFETTIPSKCFDKNVMECIEIFEPRDLNVALFVRGDKSKKEGFGKDLKGFRVRDRITHCLGKWQVVFLQYQRI